MSMRPKGRILGDFMNKSLGSLILQISAALYLFATGILGLAGKSFFSNNEIRRAVTSIFSGGSISEIIIIVLSVCAIAAGVLLLIELFGIAFEITELVLLILMIVWAVFIVIIDIVTPIKNGLGNIVEYLRVLGSHLMVLGSMACISQRFGGK
jgi:hypothetical protein